MLATFDHPRFAFRGLSDQRQTYTKFTMSVTTTSNPLTYTVQSVLTDYELHHSEQNDQPAPAPSDTPIPRTSNPPDWPENYRRIPEYRPINRELVQAERRVYQNPIEHAFIATMFTGVQTTAVCCLVCLLTLISILIHERLWRRFGGQLVGGSTTRSSIIR